MDLPSELHLVQAAYGAAGLGSPRRAGLLGIGGGMVIAPLLIELGLHPLVAAATSSLMVLFSASTAALAFAFEHLLNVTYALVFGIGAWF